MCLSWWSDMLLLRFCCWRRRPPLILVCTIVVGLKGWTSPPPPPPRPSRRPSTSNHLPHPTPTQWSARTEVWLNLVAIKKTPDLWSLSTWWNYVYCTWSCMPPSPPPPPSSPCWWPYSCCRGVASKRVGGKKGGSFWKSGPLYTYVWKCDFFLRLADGFPAVRSQ